MIEIFEVIIMETMTIVGKLTAEERETTLIYDPITKEWTMSSMIPKHFRKAMKYGWTPMRQYVYEDGAVCGMQLKAPARAITLRSAEKRAKSQKQYADSDIVDDDEE